MLLGQRQQLQPQGLGGLPVLLGFQGQRAQGLLAKGEVIHARRYIRRQVFQGRVGLVFDVQGVAGLQEVKQRWLTGEGTLLLIQVFAAQQRRGVGAHRHQVADHLQHRAVRGFVADHQQLEVGLFHQLVHAHIALGVGGLGKLPGEVFGKLGVVVRQPVHAA